MAHLQQPKEIMPAYYEKTGDVPKIAVRDLNFYYGTQQALFDNNLDIARRKVTAIIGPSGCGKSTHLRVYNRIYELYPEQQADGEVLLDGQNILDDSYDVMGLRRRCGMVFQRPIPFPMSIYDNIAFGLRQNYRLSRKDISHRVEESLRRAVLWDEVKEVLHRPGTSLSGGQQQRLCIARAISIKPEVILLDEPCSAIDPVSTMKIEELIADLKERYTIVIVTHNMSQAMRISDHTAYFFQGRIIDYGATKDIFNKYSLLEEVPSKEELESLLAGRDMPQTELS
jgi:phosphate transport system ATP-binding protein